MPQPDAGRWVQFRAAEGRFLPTSPGPECGRRVCLVRGFQWIQQEFENQKKGKPTTRPPYRQPGYQISIG
jgi:hypothetical protein